MRTTAIANNEGYTILIVNITPLETGRCVEINLFNWIRGLFYAVFIPKFVSIATAIQRTNNLYLFSRKLQIVNYPRYKFNTIYKYM